MPRTRGIIFFSSLIRSRRWSTLARTCRREAPIHGDISFRETHSSTTATMTQETKQQDCNRIKGKLISWRMIAHLTVTKPTWFRRLRPQNCLIRDLCLIRHRIVLRTQTSPVADRSFRRRRRASHFRPFRFRPKGNRWDCALAIRAPSPKLRSRSTSTWQLTCIRPSTVMKALWVTSRRFRTARRRVIRVSRCRILIRSTMRRLCPWAPILVLRTRRREKDIAAL